MQQSTVFNCGECLDLLRCEQAKSVASLLTPPERHTPPCLLVIFLPILSQISPPFLHCCKATPFSLHCLYSNLVPLTLATAAVSLPITTTPIVAILSASPSSSSMMLVSLPLSCAHCSTLAALFRAKPTPASLETNKQTCPPPPFWRLIVVFFMFFSDCFIAGGKTLLLSSPSLPPCLCCLPIVSLANNLWHLTPSISAQPLSGQFPWLALVSFCCTHCSQQ